MFMPFESPSAHTLPPRARFLPVGTAFAGLLFLCSLLAPARCAAQGAQQYLVNDDGSGEENRVDPVTVRLDDGDFLVFWEDNTSGQLDLLARRFHPNLDPVSDPQIVNDDEGISNQYDLSLSSAGGGRFAAVWLDERFPVIAVFAQIFSSADGSPIGANIELTADQKLAPLRDRPCVATNSDGNSLVCWEENTFGMRRVRAQLLGETGQRIGNAYYPVPETAENSQQSPAVAALPDGRWLLAWEEVVGSEYQVFHRLLHADGSPETAPTNDHSESIADPQNGPTPALVVRSTDALLLWTDNRTGTSDLWGRWLNLDGTPDGTAALMRTVSDPARDAVVRGAVAGDGKFVLTWFAGVINDETPLIRYFGTDRTALTDDRPLADQTVDVVSRPGSALALNDGGWLLAWSDDRSLSQQIYLRRVAADGTGAGSARQAWSVPASASQFLPDLAILPDGRAIVTWADLRSGSINIYARLLDEEGRPAGQSFQVNTSLVARRYSGPTPAETYFEHRPRISASRLGTFLITWSAIPGGGAKTLYGQLYDSDLQPIGDNFLVADVTGEQQPQSDPWPAMAPDGRFAVAWRNVVPSEQGWDDEIYIQFFDALGQRQGSIVNPVELAARPASQISPSISISAYGDLVCAWVDYRTGQWEIYRQRMSLDGLPLEEHNVHLSDDAPQFYPAVVTNGSSIVTIWEDRPNTAGRVRGRLEILETKHGGRDKEQFDFTVNDFDSPAGIKTPRVAMDDQGRFAVVWGDVRAGQQRVWCRRYDAQGNPIGIPYILPAGEAESRRQYPSVAVTTDRLQFVWGDTRRQRGWDVLTRRVDWTYNGEPVPIELESWVAEAEAEGMRIRWEIPLSATGRIFRLWRDAADAGSPDRPSARAKLVTADWLYPSTEGEFEVLDRSIPPGELQWYFLESIEAGATEYSGPWAAQWDPPLPRGWSAGPSPFRDRVELRPPAAGALRVEIWDVQGRRIRTLERTGGEETPLVWDGRDASGREAPAGLYFAHLPRSAGTPARASQSPAVLRLVRIR